jgi:hypothetical protein
MLQGQLYFLNLGILATITLEVVPFSAYASFTALLPFLKCILEVAFCKGVRHPLQFCLDNHSCVKIAGFQFHLQSRKQRKVRWVGDDSHVVLGEKFLVKKEE